MQDRYAGDIGDFGKLALLRALSPGRKLGICWYLCTSEGEANNDGKHTAYLKQPERFRELDPEVFDTLGALVRGLRSVAALEETRLLPGETWHRAPVPKGDARGAWFKEVVQAVDACDLVFADPDNGIAERATPKHMGVSEIHALRRDGRALLVYHHQTRRKGGAAVETRHIAQRVGIETVDVIRLRPYSSRFYFLFDADETLRERLHAFAERWRAEAEVIKVQDALHRIPDPTLVADAGAAVSSRPSASKARRRALGRAPYWSRGASLPRSAARVRAPGPS